MKAPVNVAYRVRVAAVLIKSMGLAFCYGIAGPDILRACGDEILRRSGDRFEAIAAMIGCLWLMSVPLLLPMVLDWRATQRRCEGGRK